VTTRAIHDPSWPPRAARRRCAATRLVAVTGFAAHFVARHRGLASVAVVSVLGIASTVFTTTVLFALPSTHQRVSDADSRVADARPRSPPC
jgi:hypothetical protein